MQKGHLGRGVSIIGVGYTPFGDVRTSSGIKDLTERELYAMACIEAMKDGGIEAKDIDAYYVGMTGAGLYARCKGAAPVYAEWIGMKNKPTLFHDEGCGTSAFGLMEAMQAVASGVYDCVISGCVNINLSSPLFNYPPYLRDTLDHETHWNGIYSAIDPAYEKPGQGGISAMESLLICYMNKYNLSVNEIDQTLAAYMQGQRRQAMMNPKAVTVTETYEDEAKRNGFSDVTEYLLNDRFNPRMGSVLRGGFLGKTVDGASAVIVCASEIAHRYTDQPIELAGMATCTSQHKNWQTMPLECDYEMFKQAYSMAGITNPEKEIDYMGIHDCTGTPVLVMSETAGYIEAGQATKYIRDGRVTFEGDKPITTSGGRIHLGHAISPSYVVEVAEAVQQMRGQCGDRQIANPPKCSVIWGGGTGFQDAVTVLRKG